MSYNLHSVMPMGNRSKGYDFPTLEEAMKGFERMKVILGQWVIKDEKPVPGMPSDIVLQDDEGNILREEKISG